MTDQLIRATIVSGGIRIVGVVTTQLTQLARQRHRLSYVSTVALGRAMAAGLLLASNLKQTQARVNLRFKGDGPLGSLIVDAGRNGTVRGYVRHPETELPLTPAGKLDVGSAIGRYGYLSVLRDMGRGEPQSSTVELVSGEIGDDVAHYLAMSEQTPSAVSLGVYLDTHGVKAAGGLLVQVLPKAARDPDLVTILESRMQEVSGFTELLQQHAALPEVFAELFGDMDLQFLPETQPVEFYCRCSFDRVMGALKLLGSQELRDMMMTDNGAEATCDFCGEVYQASEADLGRLIEELESETVQS
jgi:molecular chaperone Hsp33